MYNHFSHFGIRKTYSLIKRYYYWPKMIKHIKGHVESCSLHWREKMQANKYQLQTTEIPRRAFAKVSVDLIVELPISHYNNKNILAMVNQLTGWPITRAIPNKEATTVANAIFQKLILEHGAPEVLLSNNGKEFTNDTLAYVCQEFNTEQYFTSPYIPQSNRKTENFNKFLKASIRKLCQEDTTAWDQVLDHILFAYRCCPHTSIGEVPYTHLYNRDPPLPVQKLIRCIETCKGNSTLGKRIEQLWIALSTTAQMLERMQMNQKRHYQHCQATHKFQVGDLVLLKKHNADKMDLWWEPNYRVIRLMSPWSAIVENQMSSKVKCCNVGDLKLKHPTEDWTLEPSSVSRAARLINHPNNLPNVDISIDYDPPPNTWESRSQDRHQL